MSFNPFLAACLPFSLLRFRFTVRAAWFCLHDYAPPVCRWLSRRLRTVALLSLGLALLALPALAREPRRALKSAPERPTDPLDPLTEHELRELKQILQGHVAPDARYLWVQLQEPPKEAVYRFKPGDDLSREAFVVLLSPKERMAYELIVDLRHRKIESTKALGQLQPLVSDGDFDVAKEVVEHDPAIREALQKRGCNLGQRKLSEVVYLDTYAGGQSGYLKADLGAAGGSKADDPTKPIRAVRVLFADRQGGTNDYGPYFEGLMAIVDVYSKKVVALLDDHSTAKAPKTPHDIFDQRILGRKYVREPLAIGPSTLKRLHLEGNHVRWEHWDFRYSFNLREGLVLHRISYRDDAGLRSICYRASISEMLVPYSDSSGTWSWREFFDEGEYGLGVLSEKVEPGRELPPNAVTIDAVAPDESLNLGAYPGRVFFYERDGGALFAHTQHDQGRESLIFARGKELVVGFLSTVGNYDYLYTWVFRQDGSFGFEAELEGLILNKTVSEVACRLCADQSARGPGVYTPSPGDRYGRLVYPNIRGIFHQHWINLRLDFDIDGAKNAVKEINTAAAPAEGADASRAFTANETVFATAKQAERSLDLSTNRTWVIYNPHKTKSPVSQEPEGYAIAPGGNTVSAIPSARWGDETSFTQRHLWITPFDPTQLYAAGKYPNQAPPGTTDDLYHYAEADQSIYDTDDVVWYSLGFTHITRPEDYPIMPGKTVGVDFIPDGFFGKSPALGYATVHSAPEK